MASQCPTCGRNLNAAFPAESPCCAAASREHAATDPFRPEDFGVETPSADGGAAATTGEVDEPAAAALLTLRPRLVPPPAPVEPPQVTDSGAVPEPVPDPASVGRGRTRRLPAGIRLVISRRPRRSTSRREADETPAPAAPPDAQEPRIELPAAPPLLPPPAAAAEVAVPVAPVATPAPPDVAVASVGARPEVSATPPSPVRRTTLPLHSPPAPPRAQPAAPFVGVFGPLGQAHLVSPADPAPAIAPSPVIAARAVMPPPPAPVAAPVAPVAPPRAAPTSSGFMLPFDERETLPPGQHVAAATPAPIAEPSPPPEALGEPAPAPPRARPAQPIRPRSPNAPTPRISATPPAADPATATATAPKHRVDARAAGRALGGAVAQLVALPAALPPAITWLGALLGAALLAWIAPPLAGSFLAGLGLVMARRAEREPALAAEALGWGGLAASLGALVMSLAVARGLPLPLSPALDWPEMLLLPGAIAGLALAAAAGCHLAARGHEPFLAATAGPAAAAALVAGFGLRWGGVMVVGSALGAAASWQCWQRYVSRELRQSLAAWAVVGGSAVLASLGAVGWGYRPLPLAGALAAGILAAGTVGLAAQWSRGYDDAHQRAARAAAALSLTLVAVALVLGALAVGQPLAIGLALSPLAAVAAGLVALLQRRRAMLRIETPWLPRQARVGAIALVALALASFAWAPAGADAWTLVAAGLALAGYLAVERALDGPELVASAAALAGVGAFASGLAAAGVPLPWIPPAAAIAIAALGVAAPRLPGRITRDGWAPVALLALGACLVASLVACAFGAVTAGLAGASLAALAPLALGGRRGIVDLAQSLLAGQLPEGRRASAVAALQLGVLAFLPLAPLVALGLWPWAAPVLAAEALVAVVASRWRPTLLHPAAWLVVGSLALLPLVAHPGGWLPGLAALVVLTATGGVELALARAGEATQPRTGDLALSRPESDALPRPGEPALQRWGVRGTHRLAAELVAGAGLGAVAWAGASLSVAPIVLLGAAVGAQVIDALIADALLGRALRRASGVAWLAAALAGVARAIVDPAQGGVLLAGSAIVGVLLWLLRRERWPLLLGGLSLASAVTCGLVLVGADLASHPTAHAAAFAGVLVAWGTLESRRGARANGWLVLGLGLLAGALAVEAHLPGAPGLLRGIAALAGVGMAAAGFLSRHRVPLQVGALVLAVEGAWLLGESVLWALSHPVIGASVAVIVVSAAGGLFARLAWRAGGRAALLMAWSSDVARAREAWAAWR